jgi:hypothetical protein
LRKTGFRLSNQTKDLAVPVDQLTHNRRRGMVKRRHKGVAAPLVERGVVLANETGGQLALMPFQRGGPK